MVGRLGVAAFVLISCGPPRADAVARSDVPATAPLSQSPSHSGSSAPPPAIASPAGYIAKVRVGDQVALNTH